MQEEEGVAAFVFQNTGEVQAARARKGCSHGFRHELEWWVAAGDVGEDGGASGAQIERQRSSWTAKASRLHGGGGANEWQCDVVAVFRHVQRWPDVFVAAMEVAAAEWVGAK
ncbi:hypothetical protein DEO72_LG1g2616 [Vigna unguiculata]|uniref:Uncharacterized protein n=1 Tax=Vigna unguiculata TaxID=3917 RepID=A0A4D6KUN8_VIGUN|nr:hypothetical protein DEO72_LG1g2616 [Vigna unguiculata]